MRRKLIVGILLTFMVALVLTGCGGGSSAPTVKTLTVTGTVDDGTIPAGLGKSGKAAVTGVTVSIYDFENSHLYGTATTDGSGSFSVANIPVGADLLIVVLVTDSESVVHRFSKVVPHVTLDNNNALVNILSSAVAEILGKLYNKGIDLDPALINQIQTAIGSLPSQNFRCVPGEDFPANYGDDIPNTDLNQIQIDQIMDSAYMKGMEIVNHMKYSIMEFGDGAYKTYYLMPEAFYPLETAGGIVNDVMSYYIPDVVSNEKIFYLAPGAYTLEQVQAAMVSGDLRTGNWTLTWTSGSYSYRLALTRTSTGASAQIYETYSGGTESHVGDIVINSSQTSSSGTLNASATIYDVGFRSKKSKINRLRFDTIAISGTFTQSSSRIGFNGTATMSYENATVYTASGRFDIQQSNSGTSTITFTGSADGEVAAFNGELTIGIVSSPESAPGLSRVTADLKKFEYKGRIDKRPAEPFTFAGKIDLRVTNAASLDWAAMYNNGPSSTNSPIGTLTFSGSYISEGYSAGESFTSTFSQTAYRTCSANTEFYYDLNNRKKININISTTPTAPFSLGITSTIGVNINIARAANDQFSGNIVVDNQTVGTVQPLTNECTINFINGQSATIYSESL